MNGRSRLIAIVLALLALAIFVSLLLAAVDPSLPRSLVSSGGGIVKGSGLELNSAIGQPVTGIKSGGPGQVTLCSGFLCPEAVHGSSQVFVPLVVKAGP
jgi:hypothetical protein